MLVALALLPAGVALAACPLTQRANRICNRELRPWDRTDVFSLSPHQLMKLARALDDTGVALHKRFPSYTWAGMRPLRVQLAKAAHLGRVYSRAYRADPTDNSLPQEAAFENSLLDLGRVARSAELPACSVKLAAA